MSLTPLSPIDSSTLLEPGALSSLELKMDFFLIPNNPLKAVILCGNACAHYVVATSPDKEIPKITTLHQCDSSGRETELIAEIEWGSWLTSTIIRSSFFGGIGGLNITGGGIAASGFLYKRGFCSKYFIGDDGEEYQWRIDRATALVLLRTRTGEEIARYSSEYKEDGPFSGEKKFALQVEPLCAVSIDLIILTFIIMEAKRRASTGDEAGMAAQGEDPMGDGGGEEGGE